jgi:hypothetical protein
LGAAIDLSRSRCDPGGKSYLVLEIREVAMSSEGEAQYDALQRRVAEVVREHLTEQAIDAQPSDARREYLTKLRDLLERAAEA